jgi:hypothetical protein
VFKPFYKHWNTNKKVLLDYILNLQHKNFENTTKGTRRE